MVVRGSGCALGLPLPVCCCAWRRGAAAGWVGLHSHLASCRSRCCARAAAPPPRFPSRKPRTVSGRVIRTCPRSPSCQPELSVRRRHRALGERFMFGEAAAGSSPYDPWQTPGNRKELPLRNRKGRRRRLAHRSLPQYGVAAQLAEPGDARAPAAGLDEDAALPRALRAQGARRRTVSKWWPRCGGPPCIVAEAGRSSGQPDAEWR